MFYSVNVVVDHLFLMLDYWTSIVLCTEYVSLDNFAIILNRKWDRLLAQKKNKKESGIEYLEQRIFLKLGTGFIHD